MLLIRPIQEDDAENFLKLCKQLDEETQFMLLEPGERFTTVSEQREQIKAMLSRDNQLIFVAETNGQLAGYIAAIGGKYKRIRHSVYLIAGILQAFTGQGLGIRLFKEMEAWARGQNLRPAGINCYGT